MKKRYKFFIISAISIACFSFAGCNNKEEESAKKQLYTSIGKPNIQGAKEALKDHPEIVKETVKKNSKVKPLELAVREIDSEKVQLSICSQIIKAGADVDETGRDHDTNLCWAIENERYELAYKLIESGADVNKKSSESTPLRTTIERLSIVNYKEKMKLLNKLLESGAKPDSDILTYYIKEVDNNYGTKYYFVPKIVEKLSKTANMKNVSPALQAAIKGDNKKLQRLIRSDKVNKKDKEEVLALAAAYCNIDTLKLMKKEGYDFNWKDSEKVGLLHIASLCNKTSVVEYLLKEGLNPNAKIEFFKVNPMAFAVLGGNLNTAKILMKNGAAEDITGHSKEICNVWQFISAFGGEKAFKTLESLGHQPTQSEIGSACENCSEEQYEYLKTTQKQEYLQKAQEELINNFCWDNKGDYILELCKGGMKVKESELKELIWNGQSDIARKIMESKMTSGKIKKENLLERAVEVGDYPMVRYMVKHGAGINTYATDEESDYSCTSIQLASALGSKDILSYLKKNGGNINKKDSEGKNCKEIAKENEAVWNLQILDKNS